MRTIGKSAAAPLVAGIVVAGALFAGHAARAVHGDIQMQFVDGTTKSFDYDRGQITSIGGGSVVLIRRDGKTVRLSYDAQTIVREKGEPGAVEDLEVGDIAMFVSHQSHADLIRCIRSPARES